MKVELKPLPMKEAQEFWQDKVMLSPSRFNLLSKEAKLRAFAVSGIAKGDELATVFTALQRAIDKGTTFDQFKKECGDIFERRGWTGKRSWRVDNIFRTNIQTAYNVGRYKQLKEMEDTFPYWQYDAVNDSRTRPTHLALDGKVYPADHPFWDKWYPPNGFRCRCSVMALTKGQVERRNLAVETEDVTNTLVHPVDPRTGLKSTVPVQLLPDPGFSHHPGKVVWGAPLSPEDFQRLQGDPARWTGLVMKNFQDHGLPAAKEVADSEYRTVAQKPWPRGEKAKELYAANLAGRTIKDAAGEPVVLSASLIDHLKFDGREQYLPLVDELITNPREIWLQAEREKLTGKVVLRKRYIDFIRLGKRRMLLLAAEVNRGQWTGYTFFYTRDRAYVDRERSGLLLHKR